MTPAAARRNTACAAMTNCRLRRESDFIDFTRGGSIAIHRFRQLCFGLWRLGSVIYSSGADLNETEMESGVERRRSWWQRRWIVWTGVAFVLVAVIGAAAVMWGLRQMEPMLRRKVVETLSARFHSPVELDRLSV